MLASTMACTAASAASFTVPSSEYNSSAIAAPYGEPQPDAAPQPCTGLRSSLGGPSALPPPWPGRGAGSTSRAVTHVGDPVSILSIVLDITHSQDK